MFPRLILPPADILADLFLLFAPLRVFMYLQDKILRRKLMVIFSTCLITTIVSLVHAAYILTTGGIRVIISALVEDCVSLMVANVPVVVTAMLRASGHGGGEDARPAPTGSIISTAIQFAARKLRIKKSSTGSGQEWSKGTTSSATLTNANGTMFLGTRGNVGTTADGEPIVLDLMDPKKSIGKSATQTHEEQEGVWKPQKDNGDQAV